MATDHRLQLEQGRTPSLCSIVPNITRILDTLAIILEGTMLCCLF